MTAAETPSPTATMGCGGSTGEHHLDSRLLEARRELHQADHVRCSRATNVESRSVRGGAKGSLNPSSLMTRTFVALRVRHRDARRPSKSLDDVSPSPTSPGSWVFFRVAFQRVEGVVLSRVHQLPRSSSTNRTASASFEHNPAFSENDNDFVCAAQRRDSATCCRASRRLNQERDWCRAEMPARDASPQLRPPPPSPERTARQFHAAPRADRHSRCDDPRRTHRAPPPMERSSTPARHSLQATSGDSDRA